MMRTFCRRRLENDLAAPREFRNLGADFYDNRVRASGREREHVRDLEALGFSVTLKPGLNRPDALCRQLQRSAHRGRRPDPASLTSTTNVAARASWDRYSRTLSRLPGVLDVQ